MKRLLGILLLLPAIAFGAANDMVMSQRNATDTGAITRLVSPPASNANGILAYNGSTQLPLYWTVGSGLSLSSNALVALPQDWSVITNKPTFFSGSYNDLTDKPVLFSGSYNDLTNKPVLFSGSYNDLTNKPTIPAAQVNSDWAASSGVAQILNKPTLFSGAYADLTGKPVLFDGTWASLTGKPTFAIVATSGSYADLTNKPSIPAAQVQTDWNATTGLGVLLNKPTLFSGAYADLTGKPTLFDGTWASLTGKPTTLAGYGITDGATTSALTSGLATKFNNPTGTNTQYIRGDGSLATFPTLPTGTVTSVIAGTGLSGGTITTSGTISMPNTGTAGTYAVVTTDAQGRVTAGRSRSFTYPTRSLNTAFQISTTQDANVNYTIDVTVSALLLAGQSGRVYLEYADNAAMTTNVVIINEAGNSTGGVLNVTNLNPGNVSGWIPAGKYVRIRTANVSGTPTFTLVRSAEVLE